MQVNSVINFQNIPLKQNFKGNSANPSPLSRVPDYQPTPLNASKAYASPQIAEGYKEIETFEVPYVGKGKLYELSNGHKVILVPKVSKTYISTIVGTGFSDEPADKKDIAHLMEHLLANYWYNPKSNSDITKTLKEIGAYSNAGTSNCSTYYYTSANIQDNNDLEQLIKIQLETLKNNDFGEDKIQKEKNIIIEEVNGEDYFIDAYRIAYNQTLKNLFNIESDNGLVSDGSSQKIKNITKEDLDKFYNDYYQPRNMTTIIVGNIDTNSIKTISKYLNKMTNQKPKLQRENLFDIKDNKYINQFKRSDIQSLDKNNRFRGFVNLSFIGPNLTNIQDVDSIIILNKIIKNRLKQKNIDLDVEISSISKDTKIPQLISINGDIAEEKSESTISETRVSINKLLNDPISQEELNKAKEQVLEDMSDNLEDNALLAWYLEDKLLSDSKMDIKSSFNRLKNISPVDIQNTAKKYLDLSKASLVVMHPQKNSLQKNTNISFTGLDELKDKKDIKEYDLPNNLHVIFDSRPGIVKTAVSCQFFYENKGKNNKGIIDTMLPSLTSNENYEWPAGIWIDYDSILFRKNCSSGNIQNVITDLKNDIINPEFDTLKMEKIKRSQKSVFQEEKRIYPGDLLEAPSYGKNKNEICPEWMNSNNLKTYYKNLLSESQGTIIITIPKERLEQAELEIIKSLSEIPKVKPHDFPKILNQYTPKELEKNSIFLEQSDSTDKVIIEKNIKIISDGSIKDEASLRLLNSIINEKLRKSLREDLGLTYGVHSELQKYNPKLSIITISTKIAKTPLKENVKTAINQIDNIINQMATAKVDEDILNSTKKQIKSNLLIPEEISVNRNIDLEALYKFSYDIKYDEKLIEAIDSITPDEIQKFAQKLSTNRFLLEVSGNKDAIEANKDYFSIKGEIITKN